MLDLLVHRAIADQHREQSAAIDRATRAFAQHYKEPWHPVQVRVLQPFDLGDRIAQPGELVSVSGLDVAALVAAGKAQRI